MDDPRICPILFGASGQKRVPFYYTSHKETVCVLSYSTILLCKQPFFEWRFLKCVTKNFESPNNFIVNQSKKPFR